MGLLQRLQQLGCQLRLIEAESHPPEAPKKIATRMTSIKELMGEVQSETLRELAEKPAELTVPWEQIFASAGLDTGQKAWTIDRLLHMLKNEPYSNLGRPDVQRAILQQLAVDQVDVESLVKDALTRDQTLDAYEQFVQQKMNERIRLRQGKIAELESRMAALQKETAQLRLDEESETGQLRAWCQRKADYEKDLTWAVEFLLERRKEDRVQDPQGR